MIHRNVLITCTAEAASLMTEGTNARVSVFAEVAPMHGFESDGIAALLSDSALFSQQFSHQKHRGFTPKALFFAYK